MLSEPLHQLIAMQPQRVDSVSQPVDEQQVYRYLGYPAGHVPPAPVGRQIGLWIAATSKWAAPRAAYVILPILDMTAQSLKLAWVGGEAEFQGDVGRYLTDSRLIMAFIATAGPELERVSRELMAGGEPLGALIVDAVGAERAVAAEESVRERIRDQASAIGLTPTLSYSPGYCGIPLTEQLRLFELFAGDTVGVQLTPHCQMLPIKSISGLVGLAPRDALPYPVSACDRCGLASCRMRR
jgi:hypothetical protein